MITSSAITYKTLTKSILDIQNLYKNGHLNLEPGFQRQSVWTLNDRTKLIESILRNYPLPAIFLYKREEKGHLVFDVIDGKQRIESILMFTGAMRRRFAIKTHFPGSDSVENVDWNKLKSRNKQHLITAYEIPVIEVDGEIGEIIDLFVRINSTGKALTRQEKLHARYYNSQFLKEAAKLAGKYEGYFVKNGIFSQGQISRMKHVELICELMLSLLSGDVLNKKVVLDRVMATKSIDGRQLKKASRMVTMTLNRVSNMFPQIKTTRLSNVNDYYSLSVLIGKFEQEGMILTDWRRNCLAWDLLKSFSTKVDEVRELQRKAKGILSDHELYREYLLTVSQMTDDVSQRRKREQILRGITESIFIQKDSKRGFSPEQRRILWNTVSDCVCATCGCKLTWDDFTVDHIKPHSKGGKSLLENAALMCKKHNSSKGNRSQY